MDASQKKLISEMIEGWYVLDHILFGGCPKKYINESAQFENYEDLKKAYLTTLHEFYQHIGYKSKLARIPEDSKKLKMEAYDYYLDSFKSTVKELNQNKTKYVNLIKEGLTLSDEKKIDSRLSKIKTSMIFDKCFMENAKKYSVRQDNIKDVKGILLRNCLTEARKELLKLSMKYYPYF